MTQQAIPSEGTRSRAKRPHGVWLLTIYYDFFTDLFSLTGKLPRSARDGRRTVSGMRRYRVDTD